MAFVDCPQCKICKSDLRPKIDKMLSEGISFPKIVKYAATNGLSLGPSNVMTHNRKHRAITRKEIEKASAHEKTTRNAKIRYNKEIKSFVSASDFLNNVIARVHELIVTNKLELTVNDGLKAIELQTRLKEGGLLESSLINFMLEFDREHIQQAALPTTFEVTASSEPKQPVAIIAHPISGIPENTDDEKSRQIRNVIMCIPQLFASQKAKEFLERKKGA
jgi:hypothetical protein